MSADTARKTTRLWIQHTFDANCKIAGDLEQREPEASTRGRRLALILHGTMGHKDYLFQRRLAHALPLDSFRFDFRGAHETGGIWKMSALDEDLQDLEIVVDYLTKEFGYVIDLIVGHSRGSIVAMRWLCVSEEAKNVRGCVNVSGRYRMERMYGRSNHRQPSAEIQLIDWDSDIIDKYRPSFESQGYYEWHVNVARQSVVGRIYPHDMERFASWDSSLVQTRFPQHTHVLTVHGMADKTVPPYDAIIYSRIYEARQPGTHNLLMIEDGDHNFTNHRDEVVQSILSWWAELEQDRLKTGIWGPPPPVKSHSHSHL